MATLLPNTRVSAHALLGYRIFIWSHDHPIPPHVHFGKQDRVSSWDIQTLECTAPDGFDRSELRDQKRLLTKYQDAILDAWHEHWKAHGQKRDKT
ncbi:MAG TPA: DUF4160 domain-containing protein [Tepidisphaeraceae bacterium]|jgi:hypothetical protein